MLLHHSLHYQFRPSEPTPSSPHSPLTGPIPHLKTLREIRNQTPRRAPRGAAALGAGTSAPQEHPPATLPGPGLKAELKNPQRAKGKSPVFVDDQKYINISGGTTRKQSMLISCFLQDILKLFANVFEASPRSLYLVSQEKT